MANDSFLQINRLLNSASEGLLRNSKQLASGKRIASASSDAAGLAVAADLVAQVSLSSQAQRNIADGRSLTEIADGALSQLTDIGTRLAELSQQSANGTLSGDQRVALNNEFQALTQEAQRITQTTTFNGVNVFSSGAANIQAGTSGGDPNSQLQVGGTDISGAIQSLSGLDISNASNALASLDQASNFISQISQSRGSIGATQARLDIAENNLASTKENSEAARSRIEDLDFAQGVAERIALQIRQNAASAIFAQSREGGLTQAVVARLLS